MVRAHPGGFDARCPLSIPIFMLPLFELGPLINTQLLPEIIRTFTPPFMSPEGCKRPGHAMSLTGSVPDNHLVTSSHKNNL